MNETCKTNKQKSLIVFVFHYEILFIHLYIKFKQNNTHESIKFMTKFKLTTF